MTDDVASAPEQYKSYPTIISIDVDINCGATLENTKTWVVTRVNKTTGEDIETVDISNLPSKWVEQLL